MADLIVDLWLAPPSQEIQTWLSKHGISYEKWEAQPISDQIIFRCVEGLPEDLPEWARIRKSETD